MTPALMLFECQRSSKPTPGSHSYIQAGGGYLKSSLPCKILLSGSLRLHLQLSPGPVTSPDLLLLQGRREGAKIQLIFLTFIVTCRRIPPSLVTSFELSPDLCALLQPRSDMLCVATLPLHAGVVLYTLCLVESAASNLNHLLTGQHIVRRNMNMC